MKYICVFPCKNSNKVLSGYKCFPKNHHCGIQSSSVIMPRCACASEVYGSVFVCVCVCVDCYSCSRINEVQVRVSIGFLVMFFWILIRGFASFSSYAYLECHCSLFRRVRSQTCSLSVATLYT